jgi:hypothetical protein
MTLEATKAPEETETRLRSRALDLVRAQTLETILEADEPLRTVDVARLVAERLDLSLNEEEMGGLSSVVRVVLDSDPLFSQANRQWDLALRMGRAEGDRRKPVERALEDFIDLLGHPAEIRPVAVLAAAVYGRLPEYYEKMLTRMLAGHPQFFRLPGNVVGISRWILDLSSDDPEDVEYDNFEDKRLLDALRDATRGTDAPDPLSYARAVVEKAGEPVDNRALQFLTWCAFREVKPRDLFVRLHADDGLRLERGLSWVTTEGYEQVLEMVRAITREPQVASELVAAAVPAEEEEIGILAPTTARVSDDDLEQVYEFTAREERTYRLSELLQQVLEAFPGSRTYADVHDSLMNRMREDVRFQWVGFERFRVSGTLPAEIELLPEGLSFDEGEYLGEEAEEVDRVVDSREWKFGLDEQILHYLVQELGDDASAPASSPPARISAGVPLHHYVAGTYYLRNSDRGFFPTSPEVLHVPINTPDGSRFEVWINNRLGLVFGLKEWYDSNLPWVGGQFSLEPSDQPDEYRLVSSGAVEPLMDVPLDRLQQLLALRGEAATERLPWIEVIQRILKAYPDGAHFVSLFTQLNVVRRARRAHLAGLLSGQRFFTQTPQEPGIWHYDEKRAAKGKGKGKKAGPRRPMREYEDEGDDEFEVD